MKKENSWPQMKNHYGRDGPKPMEGKACKPRENRSARRMLDRPDRERKLYGQRSTCRIPFKVCSPALALEVKSFPSVQGYAAIGGLDEADWTVCDMHRPEQTSMDDVWQQKAGFVCFGILTQSTVGLMACEKEVYKKCRGPLAGPVVAGICVLPKNPPESLLKGLNDSKLLNEAQRNDLYARITTSEGVLWAASSINYQAGCKMQNHTFWCKVHDLKTIYTLCEGAYRCMIHGNDCFLAIFTAIDRFKPSMKPWYCVARCPGESFSRGVNLACQRNTGEKNLGLCLNTTALDTVPYFRQ
eukprot:scaffold206557_cov20-Tisochrysis_lutea.AAC.1